MLIRETYRDRFVKTYSDSNLLIRQVETGRLFVSAVDVSTDKFTYEETDIIIDNTNDALVKARAYDILMGVE